MLPSAAEGISNCLLEAMACGLIPVVSKIPGNEDLVLEENGYLFPPDAQNNLVELIESLIQKQSCDLKKAKKAQKKIEEEFNIQQIAKYYL